VSIRGRNDNREAAAAHVVRSEGKRWRAESKDGSES